MLHKWRALGQKLEGRAISALEALGKIILDAVVVGTSYGVISLARRLFGPGAGVFFSSSEGFLQAVFLPLYVAWVVKDIYKAMIES
jgi:hypothetical protein